MAEPQTAPQAAVPPPAAPTEALPSGLVEGIEDFKDGHGGASAVIEYVGRRGARIVLVGEDGSWGDQMAPATDVARDACARAGVAVVPSWERELADRMRGGSVLWSSMRRRSLAR